jgi:hypothetical protein
MLLLIVISFAHFFLSITALILLEIQTSEGLKPHVLGLVLCGLL